MRPAESAAQQARARAWLDLLNYYRKNPATLGFSYLVLAEPNAVVLRPFDLEIVPHSKVHRSYYYTMSAHGLTFFHDGETSFISLGNFEAEYFKYRQVAQVRFFAQFRTMKAFKVWKAHVSRKKARAARRSLQAHLFHMHAHFGPCLRALVQRSMELKGRPLVAVLHKEQPRDLVGLKVRAAITQWGGPIQLMWFHSTLNSTCLLAADGCHVYLDTVGELHRMFVYSADLRTTRASTYWKCHKHGAMPAQWLQAWYQQVQDRVQQAIDAFNQEALELIYAACNAALADLDKRLHGIRDGIVADEAAAERQKVGKCAAPPAAHCDNSALSAVANSRMQLRTGLL